MSYEEKKEEKANMNEPAPKPKNEGDSKLVPMNEPAPTPVNEDDSKRVNLNEGG